MLKNITFLLALFVSATAMAQLPYNPDEDSDGLITANDLLSFLILYSQEFDSDGVVPIENGGTDASDVASAKVNLKISMFTDTMLNIMGSDEAYGWISGGVASPESVAMGDNVTASGDYSQAFGSNTTASGDYSVAHNRFSNASGISSHAQGEATSASGTVSHAEGYQTSATKHSAHSEGFGTTANGLYSHSQNRNTVASGTCAHAEGEETTASADAAHSEGMFTESLSIAAHAEGFETVAAANYAHSQNNNTLASGQASHAEGAYTEASGINSHAQGLSTEAAGNNSMAAGTSTIADQTDQMAIGRFNETMQTGALFAVGNGTSISVRKDAFIVYESGNAYVQGVLDVDLKLKVQGADVMDAIAVLEQANSDLQAQVDALQELVDILIGGFQPENEDD